MPDDFTKRMKAHSEQEDIQFSSLIRDALRLYTNADRDCFVVLAKQHAGSEAADEAAKVFERYDIPQSHFLRHLIRESANALKKLKPEEDWHEITCHIGRIDDQTKTALGDFGEILKILKDKQSSNESGKPKSA